MARSEDGSYSDSSSADSSDRARVSSSRHRSHRHRRSHSRSRRKDRRHRRSRSSSRSRHRRRRSRSSSSTRRDSSRKGKLSVHPTVSLSLRKPDSKAALISTASVLRPSITLTSEKPEERSKAIAALEDDDFSAKPFISNKARISDTNLSAEYQKKVTSMAGQISIQTTDWSKMRLCHPNLLGNPIENEKRWIEKLFNIREQLRQQQNVQ